MKEGILVFVEQGRRREGAGEEVEGWGWGARMEALESLQCQSSVHCKHLHVGRREKKGS